MIFYFVLKEFNGKDKNRQMARKEEVEEKEEEEEEVEEKEEEGEEQDES